MSNDNDNRLFTVSHLLRAQGAYIQRPTEVLLDKVERLLLQ